jgi:prolyl 4-hydroxylase
MATTRAFIQLVLVSLSFAPFCKAQTCSAGDETCQNNDCVDKHEKCGFWAEHDECNANPEYMLENCALSCKNCNKDDPEINADIDTGVKQTYQGSDFDVPFVEYEKLIKESQEYIRKLVMKKDLKDLCKNQHKSCTAWAVAGECEKNHGYMKVNCAPACLSCDYLSIEGRCPLDPNAKQAWGEGDLNKMFEKLTSEPYLTKYSVETLSSPVTGGPWVITMDDVVSEEEAKRLIELGAVEGYERSTDVGKMKADGTSEKKVSTGR